MFSVQLWDCRFLIKEPKNMVWADTEAIMNHISYKTKLEFSDILVRGGFIKKTKKYFTNVCEATGANLNLSEEKWQKIEMLYAFRNAIVHGNGIWENLSPDIQNKLRDLQPSRFQVQSGEIIFTKEFLEESYHFINEVGSDLIEKAKRLS